MFKGHPKGLYALALANTGERFGYYTMLAIFTLFLQAKFGFSAVATSNIFAGFLALVYFLPLLGGILADKFGYGKMVVTGIIVMFAGYVALAIPASNGVDGKIARKKGIVTVFGQLADPVADKILTTAALLAFMQFGLCNIWIIMIVLLREFTITSFRLVATAQGIVIPANIYGKLKTISQMVFSLVIMILAELNDIGVLGENFPISAVSNGLLWITAALCVISGVIYVKQSIKLIDFSK